MHPYEKYYTTLPIKSGLDSQDITDGNRPKPGLTSPPYAFLVPYPGKQNQIGDTYSGVGYVAPKGPGYKLSDREHMIKTLQKNADELKEAINLLPVGSNHTSEFTPCCVRKIDENRAVIFPAGENKPRVEWREIELDFNPANPGSQCKIKADFPVSGLFKRKDMTASSLEDMNLEQLTYFSRLFEFLKIILL